MKKLRSIISMVLALAVCLALLTGCVSEIRVTPPPQGNTVKTNTDKLTTDNSSDTNEKNDAVVNEANKDKSVLDDNKTEINKPEDTTGKNSDKAARIGDDWEVVVSFDADGLVTEVTAYNDETHKRESFDGYEGKDYNTVVNELVAAIKNEGYYIDDVDREKSHVTIEINDLYDRDFDEYDDKYDWD